MQMINLYSKNRKASEHVRKRKDVKVYPCYQKKKNVKVFCNYKRVQNFHLERAFPVNLCVKQRLGSNRIGLVGHAISPVAS